MNGSDGSNLAELSLKTLTFYKHEKVSVLKLNQQVFLTDFYTLTQSKTYWII